MRFFMSGLIRSCTAAPRSSVMRVKERIPAPPDFDYAKRGMERAGYRAVFDENSEKMVRYPRLFKDYFDVSGVMQAKGLVPFTHGVSSGFRSPRIFLEALNKKEMEGSNFRYLRQPSAEYFVGAEEVTQKIKESMQLYNESPYFGNRGPVDSDLTTRNHILSASYSMMDFNPMESTFSFLFSNSSVSNPGQRREYAEAAVGKSMRMRGMSGRIPQAVDELSHLSAEYEKLSHGTLFVIGIPGETVDRVTYDSEAFGIPTEKQTSEVVGDLSGAARAHCRASGGFQGRIMLCKETMDPHSGIEIIDVNNEEEVASYCGGLSVEPPESDHPLSPIYKAGQSEEEEALREKQTELDIQVKELAKSLQSSNVRIS